MAQEPSGTCTTSSFPKHDGNNTPSGFVLKLYQMVNGAPDGIISVSFKSTFLAQFFHLCDGWDQFPRLDELEEVYLK